MRFFASDEDKVEEAAKVSVDAQARALRAAGQIAGSALEGITDALADAGR